MGGTDSGGNDHPYLVIAGVFLALLLTVSVISLIQYVTVTEPASRSSTTTTSSSRTYVSSISDLQLQLSAGASGIGQPAALSINITEYNTAPAYNNVTIADRWPMKGLGLGPCNSGGYPFGVAIYKGHYTSQNISSATPLDVFNYATYYCPAPELISYYVFPPSSDVAYAIYRPCGESCNNFSFVIRLSVSLSIMGYWAENPTSVSDFTIFGSHVGSYTIVAGDEWGHIAFAYYSIDYPLVHTPP